MEIYWKHRTRQVMIHEQGKFAGCDVIRLQKRRHNRLEKMQPMQVAGRDVQLQKSPQATCDSLLPMWSKRQKERLTEYSLLGMHQSSSSSESPSFMARLAARRLLHSFCPSLTKPSVNSYEHINGIEGRLHWAGVSVYSPLSYSGYQLQ